ncbi:MAG: phosphate ABC transporter permease subunit PstC [Bdellovibrionota bacterium]
MYRSLTDQIITKILWLLSIIATSIIALILFFLATESIPFLLKNGNTLFQPGGHWSPSENSYNLIPMLVGSLLIMLGGVAIAAPLGIISAIFCKFYATGFIGTIYKRIIEVLAGIPSVVFGLWGLVELVPALRHIQPPGASLLAGILVIALMILPTMTLIIDAGFSEIPKSHLNGAMALGLSRFTTVRKIILPASTTTIITGIILSGGRAIGETMAVVMVSGNIVQIPRSAFEPIRTLTANIALEMAYAMEDHRSALFVSGFILLLSVSLLLLLSEMAKKGWVRHAA